MLRGAAAFKAACSPGWVGVVLEGCLGKATPARAVPGRAKRHSAVGWHRICALPKLLGCKGAFGNCHADSSLLCVLSRKKNTKTLLWPGAAGLNGSMQQQLLSRGFFTEIRLVPSRDEGRKHPLLK